MVMVTWVGKLPGYTFRMVLAMAICIPELFTVVEEAHDNIIFIFFQECLLWERLYRTAFLAANQTFGLIEDYNFAGNLQER